MVANVVKRVYSFHDHPTAGICCPLFCSLHFEISAITFVPLAIVCNNKQWPEVLKQNPKDVQ